MRFVIVGAGAIGGTLAVQLDRAGHDVEVVARGPHLQAIRDDGLTRVAPDGRATARLPAHADVADAEVDPETVVVVATKAHQAEPVLDSLLAVHGPDVPVVAVHNGVEGERLALRRFARVYGVLINVPGVHLEPGVVEVYARAPRGVMDIGRYPHGDDDLATRIAAAWTDAEFLSEACDDIISRKWAKLLGNVGNVLQVLCGTDRARWERLYEILRAEAEAVADLIGVTPDLETQQARSALVAREDIADTRRPGGSTWQSAIRGTGDLETTMLNGEVVLQARLHGATAPANALVMAEAARMLRDGDAVGSRTQDDLLARLGR